MKRDKLRNHGFNKVRGRLAEIVEKPLDIILTNQLAGIFMKHLRKMRRHDRFRIDHNISVRLGLGHRLRHDPDGIHAEGGVLDGDPVELHPAFIAGNGKLAVGIDLVLANDGRPDADAIAVAIQGQVIADADRRNDKAEGARYLAADAGYPACQRAAAIFGDEVDQREAELDGNRGVVGNLVKLDLVRAGRIIRFLVLESHLVLGPVPLPHQ